MRNVKILMAALIIGNLVGCANHSTGDKQAFQKVETMKVGKTTISQVRAEMGPAQSVTQDTNTTILGYSYSSASINNAAYIPYVGDLFAKSEGEAGGVALTFNKKGILTDISKSESRLNDKSFFDKAMETSSGWMGKAVATGSDWADQAGKALE